MSAQMTASEARNRVIVFLRTARSMRECLPDGQWGELAEIMEYIREEKPAPDDEVWLELNDDLNTNVAWWC